MIQDFSRAINLRALYGASHPRSIEAAERIRAGLAALTRQRGGDAITFLLVGDDLVADQQPLRKGSLNQQHLVQTLKRKGVERMTLSSEITSEESAELVASFVGDGKPHSTAHVVVGRIEAGSIEPDSAERIDFNPHTPLTASKIDSVREAFVRMRRDASGGLGPMKEMIWSFIDALSQSTREILPLAPLKDHDEYTFVHSINVSLLVLAQARSFGISGDLLQQCGLAALVHDIGKLNVPLEVLNKNGRLDEDEWKIMTSHVDLGAWHLAGMESTNPLAILVAYEHHLRYDGVPSYPILKRPRRANFVSQMTSLADTYDAISTNRPYQKSQNQMAALEIIKARAGTFHDPFLVGNFMQLVQHPLSR